MKTKCTTILAAMALTAAVAAPAFGESLLLEEITVRGETEPAREESLTIREVRESPAKDVGEALQRVEGINIVRKGAIANDVVLRGLQRDNVNVLLDGVRIHGACPNRMDSPAFHYDFAEVEQIRIVKGPYDLENPGSLGGLVDVKTKETRQGVGAELNGTYGSYDAKAVSAAASYGTGLWDGLVGYAYKDSLAPRSGDGKRITEIYPDTGPATAVGRGYQEDEEDSLAYVINTAWTKWGLRPTGNSQAMLNYSYQDAQHVLYPYLLMDADYDRTHRLNGTYRVEELSSLLSTLELQAYWDRVDHLMDNRYRKAAVGTPDDYTMSTDADTTTWGAKLVGDWAVGERGALKTGVDYYRRNWNADNTLVMPGQGGGMWMSNDQPMIPDVDLDNWGVFAEYTRPLGEKLTFLAGARGDFTGAEAGELDDARLAVYRAYHPGSEDDRDFQEVSGNVQLTYQATSVLELFIGAGRGVRPPDPQELYIGLLRGSTMPNWFGNPTLKASKNYQADLGAKVFTDRFYANTSIFYSFVDDFINVADAADPDGNGPLKPARTYENVDARFWGVEFGSEVSLPLDLFLRGSLSFVRAENATEDRWLSEIPPLKGVVALRYDVDTWFVEAAENFADRQSQVDGALNEEETGGWAITDLKAGYKHRSLALYAGVNNLFDRYYFTHLSYQRDPFSSGVKVPENGRNYYATLTYEY
ncbi:MAG: TonB-dependent receptor [Proteobacteria bacterium]|nr:TonB-dependent receptor [Pseudomonadota bacterium]